jgi:DNA-binding NarL/FixJ family response regulator
MASGCSRRDETMSRQKTAVADQEQGPVRRLARVLIVDDHELLRDGLRMMLKDQPGMEPCGEAAEENEAVRLVRELHPQLVVVDVALKSGNGIDLIKQIKAFDPATRVVVYSMYEERLYGERALRAGANGYVNKQDPAPVILEAIRRVLDRKMYFSEDLVERVLHRTQDGGDLQLSPVEALSDRELEVFRLLGQGTTTRVIAENLGLSTNTVNTYRERLKVKLNLKSGTELMHQATAWVLENPSLGSSRHLDAG